MQTFRKRRAGLSATAGLSCPISSVKQGSVIRCPAGDSGRRVVSSAIAENNPHNANYTQSRNLNIKNFAHESCTSEVVSCISKFLCVECNTRYSMQETCRPMHVAEIERRDWSAVFVVKVSCTSFLNLDCVSPTLAQWVVATKSFTAAGNPES